MINGVIFDLDGVLIESEPLYKTAENEVLEPYGIHITGEVAAKYLGLKLNDYLTAISKEYGRPIDIERTSKAILYKIEELYNAGAIPLTPHASEVLEELSKSYTLTLATSREKELAQLIMKKYDIDKYFEYGVYKEDVEKGKPDPEVFLKAAETINIPPANCVVVEDAINGMKAGKAAGMYVIARKTDYNKSQDLSLADSVITDLTEILPIVKK
jgi:HAD superfamily hydrolase (TIGR01509 family)